MVTQNLRALYMKNEERIRNLQRNYRTCLMTIHLLPAETGGRKQNPRPADWFNRKCSPPVIFKIKYRAIYNFGPLVDTNLKVKSYF